MKIARNDLDALRNGKQLADGLGRAANYVLGMRRAGYRFQYPGLGKTTLRHALVALGNEDFVSHDYLKKGWKRLPKCLSAYGSREALASGKSGSPLPYVR